MRTLEQKLEALDGPDGEGIAREFVAPYFNHRTGAPHMPGGCCGIIHSRSGMSISFQCRKPTKATYGTLEYCGRHDPRRVIERQIKSRDERHQTLLEREAEDKAIKRKAAFQAACIKAVEDIAAGNQESPVSLCQELIRGRKEA